MTGKDSFGQVLREHHVIPKKRLGQHFMIDPALLQAIARLMAPQEGLYVAIEIGPGIGTLTSELSARTRKVYAIEMDESLAPSLNKTIGSRENVQVIWGDALKYDLTGEGAAKENPETSLLLCGNLPYYITSEILYSALVTRSRWARLAFVVQEEVGERMAAPPGSKDFGRLSLWCQYRAKVAVEKKISKGSFVPKPDVGSCLVTLQVKPEFPLTPSEEETLDAISRAAFTKRRKTLQNSLREICPDKDTLTALLKEAGVDPAQRPEDLPVEAFVALAKSVASLP